MIIKAPYILPILPQIKIPAIHFGTTTSRASTQAPSIFSGIQGYFNVFKFFNFPSIVAHIHTIAVILTIIFGATLIIIIIKMRRLVAETILEAEKELTLPAKTLTAADNRWEEIKKHVNDFKESSWKLAIIEADKFVDEALKNAGFQGESMGERLMTIEPGQLLSLQGLWDGHKLRNLLVHDVNYQVTHRQAILAVEAFEKVLHELGALE